MDKWFQFEDLITVTLKDNQVKSLYRISNWVQKYLKGNILWKIKQKMNFKNWEINIIMVDHILKLCLDLMPSKRGKWKKLNNFKEKYSNWKKKKNIFSLFDHNGKAQRDPKLWEQLSALVFAITSPTIHNLHKLSKEPSTKLLPAVGVVNSIEVNKWILIFLRSLSLQKVS